MKATGTHLLEQVNSLLPEHFRVELKVSADWLWRFQERQNFKPRKIHGEACEADGDAVKRELHNTCFACNSYEKEDVWNAYEKGMNSSMHADSSIS